MKPSAAFDLFLAKVVAVRGLPFHVSESDDGHLPHVPNAETVAALNARGGKKFNNVNFALAWLRDKNDNRRASINRCPINNCHPHLLNQYGMLSGEMSMGVACWKLQDPG